MVFSVDFLRQMASSHNLSTDQEAVFLRRFGEGLDYEAIASALNTSPGACLKRMGLVYKKFGLTGSTRGKESQLRHVLQHASQKRALEPGRVVVASSDCSTAELAVELRETLIAGGYQAIVVEDTQRFETNWSQRWLETARQSDAIVWLLSPEAALSDLLLEEVKLAREVRGSQGRKPTCAAIRVKWEPETPIAYDLDVLLQDVPQLEWRSPSELPEVERQLLALLAGEAVATEASPRSFWERSDGQPLPVAAPELPEGQVDLASPFYVSRPPVEPHCLEAIAQPGALIRIKAPRQMGKTSLTARILHAAAQSGHRTAYLSFQLADRDVFDSLERFLRWFCTGVSYRLELPNELAEYWDAFLGSKMNCTAYFEQYILPPIEGAVVLGLDEVDRLFGCGAIAEDFFGLLRAWHEEGKRKPLWKKLRLVVAHSTEAYIPMDVNQSPFNVGLPVELPEFSASQVQDLARRYGLKWERDRVETLMSLVGGHPFLTRVAFYQIARREASLEGILATAATEAGLFSDHLRRHLWNLEKHPELLEAMRQVVASETPIRLSSDVAFKLDSMGLVQFQGNAVRARCGLYRQYFRDTLLSHA